MRRSHSYFDDWLDSSWTLSLDRVVLESSGFLQFVGSLNPLTQLREYLKDRHERKKDAAYRNTAGERRLLAEARAAEAQADMAEVEVSQARWQLAAEVYGLDKARERVAERLRLLGEALEKESPFVDPVPQLLPGQSDVELTEEEG